TRWTRKSGLAEGGKTTTAERDSSGQEYAKDANHPESTEKENFHTNCFGASGVK
ncbi:hypothetical protein KI387_030754, partial [Taxus chinensis]